MDEFNKTSIEWSQAIQQEKEAQQQQRVLNEERAALRVEMQSEFHVMIKDCASFGDIEDMVLGYGFDLDEIENLIHGF